MKTILTAIILGLGAFTLAEAQSIHQFKVKTLEGKDFDMATLKGKKVMIVNTASECGFTPQYKELEELNKKYAGQNFVIVGFPCNDFGAQEPGSAAEIREFCSKNYGVTFPLMEKVSISSSPVYQWLTQKSQNGVEDAVVKWNFNKFLIDENGKYVKHLPSKTVPTSEEVTAWIEGK